ncbi:MAG: hypothetical protein Q8941_16085 [Bacteroidota bacterium]|nr:hypothetical protein [Bacteroidota bacterium]
MRILSILCLSVLTTTTFTLTSCTKKEDFVSEPLSDYIPLQTGKYITYRLDSLVFTNFGRNIETHRYQVKYVVDAPITDNEGRPAYRVYTYMSDSTGTDSWTPAGTCIITPLSNSIEVTENNFRVVALHLPVRDGFTWKGNIYLPTDPYETLNPTNSYDNGMNDWEFHYDGVMQPVTIQGYTYDSVTTVEQSDDAFNAPVTDVSIYGSKSRSVAMYSKDIGLVYRKYELWEYEPNTSGPSGYYSGFGITLWMVDHN